MTDLTFNIEKVAGNVNISEKIVLKENMTFAELLSAITRLFNDKLVLKTAADTMIQTLITVDNPELSEIDHFLRSKDKVFYYHSNKGDQYAAFSLRTHEILNKINMENRQAKQPENAEDDENNNSEGGAEDQSLCDNCLNSNDSIVLSKVEEIIKNSGISDDDISSDTNECSFSDFEENEDDLKLEELINRVPSNMDRIKPEQ